MKDCDQRSDKCSDESNVYLDSTSGQYQQDLYSMANSEQNTRKSLSKVSVSDVESTDSSSLDKNHSDSSEINLKHKVILLRYADSGTSALWIEGGGDNSPVIAIDLHTSLDITSIAREVAKEKAKGDDRKEKYLSKSLTTQALAEYAFCVWNAEEGCELNKKALKGRLSLMRYDPHSIETKNGWTVIVNGTSDYHGDLTVQSSNLLYSPKTIYIHAVRFGSNEKVILRGWTTAKYIKMVGRPFSKTYMKHGGRKFVLEKYSFDPSELFPMSLLKEQLAKKKAIPMSEAKQEKFNDFGF